ncbi:hypothetical protein PUR_39450 [Paenibacillus sp. URB8-2]|nr:hypothetical protein PUR_39450 [Paenibacillus sp. URB8-2]
MERAETVCGDKQHHEHISEDKRNQYCSYVQLEIHTTFTTTYVRKMTGCKHYVKRILVKQYHIMMLISVDLWGIIEEKTHPLLPKS